MLKLFTNLCAMLIVFGIILTVASIYTNISVWYGIEMTKGAGTLFIMFLFMHLLEEQKKANEQQRTIVE
ncbi:hypothetical protein D1B33_05275 [Lysinibacillus yapensis]|uniref:Uncharacterized protein n=1 Tax=Ureibacillus yapensis TaxID=2304605 RepID=A0A396SB91_9BACL|nr:hypothetical protein [Lysinibacillus yapensis]RHW38300.1 hypothetical protein D1B33_05275 [Lysinibacillus yapensis]